MRPCNDPCVISKLLKLVVLAAVVALALGAYVGTRLPLGDAHLSTTEATAQLENRQGLVLADETDGDRQFTFRADSVHWSDGSTWGEGPPPCLREVGRKVDVEIGHTSVALPEGGTRHDVVLWVGCP